MNYANKLGYSDIVPHEVIRKVSDTTMDIRRMDAEFDKSVKLEFHVGGFSANCSNQNDQKWFITSNENNYVFRIRYSKAKKQWQDSGGDRYNISHQPVKFYDYNF